MLGGCLQLNLCLFHEKHVLVSGLSLFFHELGNVEKNCWIFYTVKFLFIWYFVHGYTGIKICRGLKQAVCHFYHIKNEYSWLSLEVSPDLLAEQVLWYFSTIKWLFSLLYLLCTLDQYSEHICVVHTFKGWEVIYIPESEVSRQLEFVWMCAFVDPATMPDLITF